MSLPSWTCSGGSQERGWRRRSRPPRCGHLRAASRRSLRRRSPRSHPGRPWWSWWSTSTPHCPSPRRLRSWRRSRWTHLLRRRLSCRPRRGCSSWGRSWCRRGRWRRRTGCRRRWCSSAWPHHLSSPLYSAGPGSQLKIEREVSIIYLRVTGILCRETRNKCEAINLMFCVDINVSNICFVCGNYILLSAIP